MHNSVSIFDLSGEKIPDTFAPTPRVALMRLIRMYTSNNKNIVHVWGKTVSNTQTTTVVSIVLLAGYACLASDLNSNLHTFIYITWTSHYVILFPSDFSVHASLCNKVYRTDGTAGNTMCARVFDKYNMYSVHIYTYAFKQLYKHNTNNSL